MVLEQHQFNSTGASSGCLLNTYLYKHWSSRLNKWWKMEIKTFRSNEWPERAYRQQQLGKDVPGWMEAGAGGDDESRKSISCFRRDVRGVVRRKGGNRNKRDGLDGGVVRVLWGTTLQSKCRTVAEILIASCLLLSNLPIKTIQFWFYKVFNSLLI